MDRRRARTVARATFPAMRLAAAFLVLAAAAGPARAEEGESALSVSVGFASFAIPEHEPPGGAAGLEYERGLSDVSTAASSSVSTPPAMGRSASSMRWRV